MKEFKPDIQFVKFLFVGGLNTVFGYCMFSLFIFLKCHYALATLFSTVLGILFNFKTTGVLVFKNHDNKLLIKFFAVYTLLYFIGIGELKLMSSLGFNNMYLNYAIFILPNAMLSFILMKKTVFNK